MSTLRQLVENDCGGLNPLMQLGARFNRDTAHRDERLLYQTQLDRTYAQNKEMVNEFLHQVNQPPQTFHMETLLQEMREIEQQQQQQQQQQHQQQQSQSQSLESHHHNPQQPRNPQPLVAAPRVIEQVTANQWSQEYQNNMTAATNETITSSPNANNNPAFSESNVHMMHLKPQEQQITHVQEFFMDPSTNTTRPLMTEQYSSSYLMPQQMTGRLHHQSVYPAMYHPPPPHSHSHHHQGLTTKVNGLTNQFFDEVEHFKQQQQQQQQQLQKNAAQRQQDVENTFKRAEDTSLTDTTADQWVKDFQKENEKLNQQKTEYHEKFWEHLRGEWSKLAAENNDYSWLTDYDEEVYNEYNFLKENPMKNINNALEKGKEYMARGDIPSAVLCFEVAVQQQPTSVECWQLLGMAQAKNEMDPQAINALKEAHALKPDEPDVLMALAICYTNECLQMHAVKMLLKWLNLQEQYRHLIPEEMLNDILVNNTPPPGASSIIRPTQKLVDVQEIFLAAARLQPDVIDPRLQEALGVLYNLSTDYDKAVDCFRAALHVQPHNAKIWNRLGASLANGNRSVEAIDAYQRALALEPGFIRVRYNVGICCLNLKAYHEAAEHLITALNMQANVTANRDVKMTIDQRSVEMAEIHMSQSIWSTLKMAVTYLGRRDLLDIIDKRNLDELNAEFREDN